MNTKQIIAAIGEQVKNLKQARNALLAYLPQEPNQVPS